MNVTNPEVRLPRIGEMRRSAEQEGDRPPKQRAKVRQGSDSHEDDRRQKLGRD